MPLGRGFVPTDHQHLVRELILLLKRGYLDTPYFKNKFGADIIQHWKSVWDGYAKDGYVEVAGDKITLTRKGLLVVDGLLPAFFEPEHQGVRYT